MITAVIRSGQGVGPLAVTLAGLVAGVAEGLVADAVVVVDADDEATSRVADAVGAARLVLPPGRDPWRAAAALARREWLLCLGAGDCPADGWVVALERRLAVSGDQPGLFRLRRRPTSLAERLERWRETALGARAPRPGDLVHRALLSGGDGRRLRPIGVNAVLERLPWR